MRTVSGCILEVLRGEGGSVDCCHHHDLLVTLLLVMEVINLLLGAELVQVVVHPMVKESLNFDH
jgi:hypothetical protein